MSSMIVKGNASGSGSVTLQSANTNSALTQTLPSTDSVTLGYLNAPAVGTKTGSYTLATADVGKYVQIGSGGSITIPDATFAEGDIISLFNNTSGSITITTLNQISTAYIAGTNTNRGGSSGSNISLATRGVATILFISSTVCVVSGNVS